MNENDLQRSGNEFPSFHDSVLTSPHIIIIDSNAATSAALKRALQRHAFVVDEAYTAEEAKTRLRDHDFDIIVLDTFLTDGDGLSILKALAMDQARPGILVRADTVDEIDRIVALELGADDCVSKSCSSREVNARVRSILRRRSVEQTFCTNRTNQPIKQYLFAGWRLNISDQRIFTPSGERLKITNSEYMILSCLLKSPGSIKDRTALRGLHVEDGRDVDARSMDVIVSRLRRKLAGHCDQDLIETVRGRGYRFIPPVTFSTNES